MKLAIIGCGEVGRLYAAAAAPHFELVLCDAYPSAAAQELAEQLGVELKSSIGPWLADMDRVWACVTGDVAVAVAEQASGHISAGALYADLSTANSADKRKAAELLEAKSAGYVDIAIMGAVGLTEVRTNLLAAGTDAASAVTDFGHLGAPARALENATAGDAIALKLLRTVLTKGLEALGVEALIAAESQGVRAELYRVLEDIDTEGFTNFLNAVVRTHVLHAERRSHEVDRAIAQLDEAGLPSSVLAGTRERYEQTVQALKDSAPAPGTAENIDSAVSWLLESSQAAKAIA
ncbi:NAD(P)-binding domain-containing protein [Pseudarthrobacter sp. B4EP4b]|uniref:NAD(P)-binding domain-containing protein n=1 Tax=Pseudarthrobacter sp. B4EP4b TaxID=2590664 RepID=UPI00114F62F4|nr:NAD(P)-dependent oxidoreductase [Pseudarthrobacter sp. B4EP4b]